jgi:hypothetical protein
MTPDRISDQEQSEREQDEQDYRMDRSRHEGDNELSSYNVPIRRVRRHDTAALTNHAA